MYVVRRTFRNYGKMMVPGSIVEPGTTKMFKSRLRDGHIIEVPEQDFEKWNEYFKVRFGVAIQVATGGIPTEPANLDGTKSVEEPAKEPAKEPIKVAKPVAAAVVRAK